MSCPVGKHFSLGLVALLCVLLSPAGPALAQSTSERYTIELLTIEPGDHVFNMFGHSALRVVDRQERTDQVFNWGTVRFTPDLTQRFVAGPLDYYLSVEPFERALGTYRRENRRVVGQPLRLSQPEAARLVARIVANAKPESCTYRYHHFRENCSTKLRDLIDEISGGALQRSATGPSGRTFREHLYEVGAPPAEIVLAFDLLCNSTWDEPVSRWDALFLPQNLHDEIAQARASDGELLGGRERTYLERQGGPVPRVSVRPGWYIFSLPALLLLLALGLGQLGQPAGRPVAAVGYVLLGLLSGLTALAALAAWTLTAHADLAASESLIYLWPTDLALVICGPQAMGAKARHARITWLYLLVRAATFAAGLLLLLAGVLGQPLWSVALPTLAALVAGALLARRAHLAAAHEPDPDRVARRRKRKSKKQKRRLRKKRAGAPAAD